MFSRKHPKIFHFTPSLFLCLLSPRFHGTLRSVLVFPKKKKKGCTSNMSRRNVLNPCGVQIDRSKQHTSKNKKNISVRLECQARYNVRRWKVRGYASFLSLLQNTRRVHLDAFLSNKFFFLSFLIFLFLSLFLGLFQPCPTEREGEREREREEVPSLCSVCSEEHLICCIMWAIGPYSNWDMARQILPLSSALGWSIKKSKSLFTPSKKKRKSLWNIDDSTWTNMAGPSARGQLTKWRSTTDNCRYPRFFSLSPCMHRISFCMCKKAHKSSAFRASLLPCYIFEHRFCVCGGYPTATLPIAHHTKQKAKIKVNALCTLGRNIHHRTVDNKEGWIIPPPSFRHRMPLIHLPRVGLHLEHIF